MKLYFSSRGLLKENNQVLFIEYKIENETYYALPGGTLEIGENLKDCVIREFQEETGIQIDVENLILLNEFINPSPKAVADSWKNGIHQIESIFRVKRKLEQSQNNSERTFDYGMQGFVWLKRSDLKDRTIYPSKEIDWFFSEKSSRKDLYLTRRYS